MGRVNSVVDRKICPGHPNAVEDREGKTMMIPFALELYIRHIAGETAEELSLRLGIPRARVQQRLRAGAAFAARHASAAAIEAEAGQKRAA